ncbi:universal stress protein [Streptomyces sp. NPDC002992]|uniref:universal stress protein n=1 Tax=Streptomyces sp. NPDC002992 TaxID=3154273 RepID=UPI0033B26CF6
MSIGDDRTAHVVVGVDGSPASHEALRWAVRHARLIGATVDAVAAYDVPGATGWAAPAVDAGFDQEQARRDLSDEIRTVLVQADGVPLREHVVQGNPAQVLIAASAGAELLVVGSRGRGGFASLLLGSVSQQCATHASCPVVIVRAESSGEALAAEVPAMEVPAAGVPPTEAPAAGVATAQAPATEIPVSGVPGTQAPGTDVPAARDRI